MIPHNIQVWENHSGPLPEPKAPSGPSNSYKYAYVAYADPEADSSHYGYGHTPSDAITDYCRNKAEALCSSCTEDACPRPSDCILTSGYLSTLTQQRIEEFYNSDGKGGMSTTHQLWRIYNTPLRHSHRS